MWARRPTCGGSCSDARRPEPRAERAPAATRSKGARARPAVEADVDGIVAVRRAAYTMLHDRYPSAADFESHLDEMSREVLTQGSLVLAVEDEQGQIVGTVTVIGDYIRMLAVKPPHQGQGIARELLRAAVEHGGLYLNTAPWMTEARGLYKTLGYQIDDSKTTRVGSWELLWYAVGG